MPARIPVTASGCEKNGQWLVSSVAAMCGEFPMVAYTRRTISRCPPQSGDSTYRIDSLTCSSWMYQYGVSAKIAPRLAHYPVIVWQGTIEALHQLLIRSHHS